MTQEQIIEAIKAIRNQITTLQYNLEDDSLVHTDSPINDGLWDAQEVLGNILEMIEPNPYK